MNDSYPLIVLILGLVLVVLSLFYKYLLKNNKRFLEIFYVGHILILSGIISSGFGGLSIIVICIAIFIVVSILSLIVSIRLRRKGI